MTISAFDRPAGFSEDPAVVPPGLDLGRFLNAFIPFSSPFIPVHPRQSKRWVLLRALLRRTGIILGFF